MIDCGDTVATAGWDTAVVIILDRKIMVVVVVGIITNAVFKIVIVIVVNGEGPTLSPISMITIIGGDNGHTSREFR